MKTRYYSQDIPAYGTIPYSGKTWTITFKRQDLTTSMLEGYGEFPFNDYPDLPVINYKDNDKVFEVLKAHLMCSDCCIQHGYFDSWNYLPLNEYLKTIHDMGIEIINYDD